MAGESSRIDGNIARVGVIGAGQMGAGIAQAFASAGFLVTLSDTSPAALKGGIQTIEKSTAKFVEKEKLSADERTKILSRVQSVSELKSLAEVDLIVEAIIENVEIKCALFRELDAVCKSSTILASNTSSISITKLAAATSRPEKVVGMHFMNPVPLMKLVELIRGVQTDDATFNTAIALVEKLGKTSVKSNFDYPGFIVNRVLMPMLNEACFALMEGLATVEDIDTAMKLGTNQPMGPLELADFVGLDTVLSICRIFHTEFGDDKYRPCPLLVKYVEAGWLGKKAGRGFYRYDLPKRT